jgi:hypothetical protein
MATEEPPYESLEKSGDVELRRYAPMILAETLVEGDLGRASSDGFRRIAAYIFGDNRTASGDPGEKIAMTAPVTMEPEPQRIEMTAPVTIEGAGGSWRMSFVMPTGSTMATLPSPTDPRVTLREIPERTTAALTFSGLAREEKIARKTGELRAWLAGRGIEPTSPPRLARYNPPWTPPFLRRNEILVDCAPIDLPGREDAHVPVPGRAPAPPAEGSGT